ncbi:heme-binding protein 2-like [Hypanus sabinus]|uniref:heme-binding protein 2-like n=1 Tax=Hypanus sabinus TaxID=79690 RepID=UPI0028C42AB1|nr:heme-binding protein 2-like [Hypanus sabinus]XP_059813476.1 heme-binding protein 2-like [Hypanus sabinus]XP_059813477.1 heme-binding protein 2-like [Hypanus sabinus]
MLPLLLWTLPLLCQGVAAQWSRTPLTCTDASECPSYITVCRNLDYETRAYAPTVWVGTQVLPTEGRYQSVQRLREYFNKRNRPVIQIERTAPTLTMYQNVNDVPRPIAVFTYLPRRFLFNPPIPRDELVYLTLSPARTVFVRLASPFLFNVERTSQELFEDLLRQAEAFAQDHFYVAEYSSPLRLFGRRNEVWYLALGIGRCDPGPGRPSFRL